MFARFFVDRPVFATVLSIVIVIVGLVAMTGLPMAQYPEIAPPTISITTIYPGASADIVANTVAAPIEQEVNGVENMLYMLSKCTNDGMMTLDVTFKLGTNIDMAQVLTQNRVSVATAKLPEEVRRQGVVVKKRSPSILLCVNLISTDPRLDQLYLSNYATIQLKDSLARVPGVGDVSFLGSRDYSMRVWLDPARLAALNLSAGDVMRALREQNVQVAAGRIGQPPAAKGQELQLTINSKGRLLEAQEFENVIVKTGETGQVVRIRDIGRTELGAKSYDVSSYLDGQPSVTMAIFQQPGSNALATAEAVRKEMARLSKSFADGVEYKIVYDTTIFIDESVHEVYKTLFEAFVLVFIVVLLFLQDWRAALLPMIDVPVSLIGTLAVMHLLGFSLNNLSLFGLVLAIGIVVDDAIVVVENIERWIHQGFAPREATIKAMDEVTGPVIAVTLVLSSVFIPAAFISGITGQFYRQFALTIAASTIISAINALTMAPARAVSIFKPPELGHEHDVREALPPWGVGALLGGAVYWLIGGWLQRRLGIDVAEPLGWWTSYALVVLVVVIAGIPGWFASRYVNRGLAVFFGGFNAVFDRISNAYGAGVRQLLRVSIIMLLVYGGLMALAFKGFATVPVGFIPPQDKGYLVVSVQLPDGASLERTEALMRDIDRTVSETHGVAHTLSIPGYNILSSVNLSSAGGMFVILDDFEERKHDPQLGAFALIATLQEKLSHVIEARVAVFGAPPVEGVGNTGGFKLYVQDRGGSGAETLQGATSRLVTAANAQPGLRGVLSTFRASQPQLYVEIDRTKAKSLGLPLSDINETLQTYLGSAYANDFTQFGRNWQVNVQADADYRSRVTDIGRLQVRTPSGKMVPLGTLVKVNEITGPSIVNRYNMYPAAEVMGATAPGVSSGDAVSIVERLAADELPRDMSFEWTELTLQEILAGNTAVFVFSLGTLFVFMVLAAQYESWGLPFSVILIVPMCLLAAIAGVWIARMDNNIFTQIGLVVLIGLAAKNAILIVEFAEQQRAQGASYVQAIVDACRLRLRPIIMTSLAFILGVVPLLVGKGAGAEMRFALGLAVFSGMLGVTFFGLIFTPVFYDLVSRFSGEKVKPTQTQDKIDQPTTGKHS